jgi:hypothetical protein
MPTRLCSPIARRGRHQRLRALSDLGMEKGQSPVNDELADKVVAAGQQRLAG